jgi:hypothetical protein
LWIAGKLFTDSGEQRLLEREDERRDFGRREAFHRAGAGELPENVAHFVPLRPVSAHAALRGVDEAAQECSRIVTQVLLADQIGAVSAGGELQLEPVIEDRLFMFTDHILNSRLLFSRHQPLLGGELRPNNIPQ